MVGSSREGGRWPTPHTPCAAWHLCGPVPAPHLPVPAPSSTGSQFLGCSTSQLVLFSPTSCLRTHSPAICPPPPPKPPSSPAAPCHLRGTVSPLSLRAKDTQPSLVPFLSLSLHTHAHRYTHARTHTHTHTHTHTRRWAHTACFSLPSSLDTSLFIWILLPNEFSLVVELE